MRLNACLSNQIDPATFVIFLHIQKTAGITIQTQLRQRFGPGTLKRAAWRLQRNRRLSGNLLVAANARTPNDGYFGGHFCFGIHHQLPKPASYMTFLRDPVKRVISLYKYSRENPMAFYHKFAKDRTLADFALDSGLQELDNGMTRFVAGISEEGQTSSDYFINRMPFGSVDEELLLQAQKNLEAYFFFVGLQERFDESFLLLSHFLGVRKPRYLRLNTSNTKETAASRDPELIAEIKSRSTIDQKLYEYAGARLQDDLDAVFPNIESTLADFRSCNSAYNKRMRPIYNFTALFRPRSFRAG